jgi:chloramphenicol 3-O-phosphotransferase
MDLIFLHGGAASGKLTTARALSERIGFPVFHNHLVVDLLTTVFPFGSEPFVRLREELWLSVFRDAARAGTSTIFTFAPESSVEPGFSSRVVDAVEREGGRVRFVKLAVSEEVQEQRIVHESRREFHKLADLDTLRRLRATRGEVEEPPSELEIDTDASPASASAEAIIERFGLRPQALVGRYEVP